jgi:hypothetical protein
MRPLYKRRHIMFSDSNSSPSPTTKNNNNIVIGFIGQVDAILRFKQASNLFEYLRERPERKLNLPPGSYDINEVDDL